MAKASTMEAPPETATDALEVRDTRTDKIIFPCRSPTEQSAPRILKKVKTGDEDIRGY